jgi:L,D-transpeptidase catalytic domain
MGFPRTLLIGAVALCALPASAAASVWTLAGPAAMPGVTWGAPTPAEGARLQARVGRRVSFGLAASGPGESGDTVTIRAASLPAGAALQPRDANPATASFSWTPRAGAARRTYTVTFTAQSSVPGIAPATRRVSIAVAPRPRPRRRAKPERFVLSGPNHLYRYAFVLRAGVARSAPRRTSAVVASLSRWTPEGTTNLVLTLDGRRTRRGVWIRVRLATLPNGRTGWVHRRMLSDWKEVRTRLVVDRRRLTATLYRRGRVIFRAPVGVGLSRWPTPRGEFYIRNQLYGFGNPVYGPLAFGTSARSAVLTDWPGGGFIGLHGTNQPYLLPGRVSHGCIRMKNGHILRLARLMPVGTPLTVK